MPQAGIMSQWSFFNLAAPNHFFALTVEVAASGRSKTKAITR
jgi:hypothetical protein